MSKMLISASQADEMRVALVKEQNLYDLDIERLGFQQKKANIYKAKVSRVEPSLEAAFVDYGADRHGFLPFKEVARSILGPEFATKQFSSADIKNALQKNREILVQVDKEERGHKGAALTTFISLAGSYLVLMPNNPRAGGVSRRIDDKERSSLKDILPSLNLPEGMGIIARTAGVGKSETELKWDLDSLLRRWKAIEEAHKSIENPTPSLIYQEGDAVIRAVRDYLRQDITEIIVDTPEIFEKTKQYIEQVKPDFIDKVTLYQSKVSLFSFHQIEEQIETAYQRVVRLPSGGSISIDHTEALISIDVNSAKSTGGSDIEATACHTNLEAAEEIAKQLRLRDIGGLIVIDFIDMSHMKNQREVSHKLKESLEYDRARVQVGHITRFGLLEMSRQRLRAQLGETTQLTCPRCEGQGTIRGIESLSSSMIRLVEEEAAKEGTSEIQIQLPVGLATFIINERRTAILGISNLQGVTITILPNQYMETPQYKIKRIRTNDTFHKKEASYKLVGKPVETTIEKPSEKKKILGETAVVSALDVGSKNCPHKYSLISNLKKFFSKIFGRNKSDACTTTTSKKPYKANPRFGTRGTGSSQNRGRPSSRGPRKYQRRSNTSTTSNTGTPSSTTASTSTPSSTNSTSSVVASSTSSSGKQTRITGTGATKGRSSNYNRRTPNNKRSISSGTSKKLSPPPSDSYPEINSEKVKNATTQNTTNEQKSPVPQKSALPDSTDSKPHKTETTEN